MAKRDDRLPILNEDPRGWPFKVCITLFHVAARLERRMMRSLAARGVSRPQFEAMATLYHGEGITQQELAERMIVTKGNIVGLVDRLAASGWVARRPDPEDRRINRLELTDAGRCLVREILPAHVVEINDAFRHLDEGDLRRMHALLEEVDAGT